MGTATSFSTEAPSAKSVRTARVGRSSDSPTPTTEAICPRFETMKLYSALGTVRHLLETGQVEPGDTLVDGSSGIYAHALALACHRYGPNRHIVGSTTADRTLRVQLEILGATLEQVRPSKSLRPDQNLRVERIGELLRENPRHHWMRQYHDAIHHLGGRDVADLVRKEVPAGPPSLVGDRAARGRRSFPLRFQPAGRLGFPAHAPLGKTEARMRSTCADVTDTAVRRPGPKRSPSVRNRLPASCCGIPSDDNYRI